MDETYNPSEDPRSFLHSYPVIQRVIRELRLQATLIEPKMFSRLAELWNVLKTAWAYKKFKQERPSSSILSKNILVPNKPVIDELQTTICCSELIITLLKLLLSYLFIFFHLLLLKSKKGDTSLEKEL